ncbi:hypothetical protein CRG98_009786 [Punica granatum]|uniref:Uncharacterized protein n=1 Tax=Punica granatum TaxID=22663 RepID=A0A2I0KN51_PUNGR|nr:hypothetical protein CRG98_009786 [Punica granatum]
MVSRLCNGCGSSFQALPVPFFFFLFCLLLLLLRGPDISPLRAHQNPNSTPIVLFIVSGPHRGGSQILLRFYALQRGSTAKFTRPKVVCKQKGLTFEPNSGVSVDNHHGFSVKLSGSVNLFSMYSISSSKVWVYGVRTAGDERASEDGLVVKLMKYAVIESCRPVWSICVAFGLAVFGEENGVRVFDLRLLGKGHSKKVKNMTSNSKNGFRGPRLPNGVISESTTGHSENACDCHLEGKIDKHCGSIKQKCLKLKQDTHIGHACYVTFERDDSLDLKSPSKPVLSLKATSIQALSPETFMVLDSHGDLHLLCLPKSNTFSSPNFKIHLRRLPCTMKVQHLAALPDSSLRAETVWVSDGHYSVHVINGCDIDAANGEKDGNDIEEKLRQISVGQAIFTSEKIQALVPLSSHGTLILGQDRSMRPVECLFKNPCILEIGVSETRVQPWHNLLDGLGTIAGTPVYLYFPWSRAEQ